MRTLVPVLQHRVWGGDFLSEVFPQAHVTPPVGEAWLLSDHPSSRTVDEEGRDLQGLAPERPWFPVLIKLLHAQSDLSVQVHPNDDQARAIGDLGKTEGWLILAAEPGARICFGHTAETAEQLREAIAQGDLERYLRYVAVQPGQYYAVPPGTVHALGGGIVALEVQQSSDTTYRLYDYNRRDASGQLRDLHVEDGLTVTTFPQPPLPDQTTHAASVGDRITYEDHRYYSVSEVHVSGEHSEAPLPSRLLCVILLSGIVAPVDFARTPSQYQTWLFNEGEIARLAGNGRVALVTIPIR